jgi:hypothetical protein
MYLDPTYIYFGTIKNYPNQAAGACQSRRGRRHHLHSPVWLELLLFPKHLLHPLLSSVSLVSDQTESWWSAPMIVRFCSRNRSATATELSACGVFASRYLGSWALTDSIVFWVCNVVFNVLLYNPGRRDLSCALRRERNEFPSTPIKNVLIYTWNSSVASTLPDS